jgi:hypothetical protein
MLARTTQSGCHACGNRSGSRSHTAGLRRVREGARTDCPERLPPAGETLERMARPRRDRPRERCRARSSARRAAPALLLVRRARSAGRIGRLGGARREAEATAAGGAVTVARQERSAIGAAGAAADGATAKAHDRVRKGRTPATFLPSTRRGFANVSSVGRCPAPRRPSSRRRWHPGRDRVSAAGGPHRPVAARRRRACRTRLIARSPAAA